MRQRDRLRDAPVMEAHVLPRIADSGAVGSGRPGPGFHRLITLLTCTPCSSWGGEREKSARSRPFSVRCGPSVP